MGRKSTIFDLPDEIVVFINCLLADGHTIDDIKARLDVRLKTDGIDADPSRSALGRYKMNQDALSSELKRSRMIAEALIRESDPDAADSQMSRIGIEMLQAIMMKMVAAKMNGDALDLDAKEAHFLARSFKDLSSAQSIDAARIAKIRDEERKKILAQASEVVDAVAKGFGFTKDIQAEFRKEILKINR